MPNAEVGLGACKLSGDCKDLNSIPNADGITGAAGAAILVGGTRCARRVRDRAEKFDDHSAFS